VLRQKNETFVEKKAYKPDSSVPAATNTLTCVRALLQ
jgi:hypothetical protein